LKGLVGPSTASVEGHNYGHTAVANEIVAEWCADIALLLISAVQDSYALLRKVVVMLQ
jgi:hypothetical protein